MSPNKSALKSARQTSQATKPKKGFSSEERAAMKARAAELKAEARINKNREEGERAVLAKIAGMTEPERGMAKKIHAIVKIAAPELLPRTWYGMPAYAKGDKVVCFFQSAKQFKTRYSTLGFSDEANLDEGDMWPTSYALKKISDVEEAKIAGLVKRAVGN